MQGNVVCLSDFVHQLEYAPLGFLENHVLQMDSLDCPLVPIQVADLELAGAKVLIPSDSAEQQQFSF